MLKVLFGGDVVLSRPDKMTRLVSEDMRALIGECRIACCNFEAPAGGTVPIQKIGPNLKNDQRTVWLVKDAGFNLAACANNHIFDYGKDGLADTIRQLKDARIDMMGAGLSAKEIKRPYIFEEDDIKIGMLNVAENGFGCCEDGPEPEGCGYAYIFDQDMNDRIAELKRQCDHVFVVCHAGAELWEIPLPEWRKAYRDLIDHGADGVIAHHPHVPQGYEEYHGKPIFYSLGNFAFDKGNGPFEPISICVRFSIDKRSISYEVIPVIFNGREVSVYHDPAFLEHYKRYCDILKNDAEYMAEVNRKCREAYDRIYKNCYEKVVCKYYGNIIEIAKGFVKRFILRIRFQDIWLYHNLAIETHYYICKRASKLALHIKSL